MNSNGMQHLKALAEAGLTHIHLLQAIEIACVNENYTTWKSVDEDLLKTYGPASELQAQAIAQIKEQDGFNWGYDPYHYTTPEGSYATNPFGYVRILEFREMVQALNQNGLRVVMDVVYNHTSQSGQDEKSVLDKSCTGYYNA
jgi:pullulanase/glycogen debranching enzyme